MTLMVSCCAAAPTVCGVSSVTLPALSRRMMRHGEAPPAAATELVYPPALVALPLSPPAARMREASRGIWLTIRFVPGSTMTMSSSVEKYS